MIAKLLKPSKKIRLQHQLLVLLILSNLLPATVGLYGTLSFSRAASDSAVEELEEETLNEAGMIDTFLNGVNDDVLFLSQSASVQGIIRARAAGGTDPETGLTTQAWRDELAKTFVALLESKSRYQKFRYMDENGNELIRIEKDNENRDQIRVIPDSELQNKANRPYFNETMQLEVGDVAVSRVNLQVEQKRIIQPQQPVMQYTTPVRDAAGNPRGIIVGNIFADEFVDLVEGLETEEEVREGEQLMLVAADGSYISHPDEAKEWGLDLGLDDNLKTDYPEKVAEAVLTGEEGTIEADGQVISYAKVDFSPNQAGRHLYVLEQAPRGSVYSSVNAFKRVAFLVVIFATLVTLPLGILRGRQLVELIQQLINGISSASQQIFSTIAEQERVANQQAASVNETTTTMDELEASSRQSAEQANAAVVAAKRALQRTQEGSHAVGETLEGMFTLEQKVEAIAEQIVNLSGQAGQIGGISELVADFANQTNMLALNSSVEAVRAGEHGKGFAVVANEIRKLSDQSQQSAEKINTLVNEIQKAINATVMVTEEGTKTVKTGVQAAQHADHAFQGIKESIDTVVINNQQVSLTLKQQVDAIRQVVEAMAVIDRGSKETAAGLTQTLSGTEHLNQTATSLRQMV
ncbi:MAG: methyl-accepting chemotaxis protein [Leptolyngbya sp. SIO4C1]|nr:methyl-accepting chemotaxis protein [Leptolyngbya sp. SIO4C1]